MAKSRHSRRKTSGATRRHEAARAKAKRQPGRGGKTAARSKAPGRKEKAPPQRGARAARAAAQRAQSIANLSRIYDTVIVRRPIESPLKFARPDDLLVCSFSFENLKVEAGKLVRKNPGVGATLIVGHQPQSFAEQAFLDADPEMANEKKFPEIGDAMANPNPNAVLPYPKPNSKNVARQNADALPAIGVTRIIMAGRSRVAFKMPDDESSLDYTLAALLDACHRWEMRLDANAVPEPQRSLEAPEARGFDKSWLELITRSAGWAHTTQTVLDALGDAQALQAPLETAAKRIARQSARELNQGRREGLYAELAQAMNLEIDRLAESFESLRDDRGREAGLGVLALKTASEFAVSDFNEFELGHVELLPFLPLFFGPHQPSPLVTALELPYRVMLSPIPPARWRHALAPVVHHGRTELWHTRLHAPAARIGPDAPSKLRALWSPDYELAYGDLLKASNGPLPFRMSLDALDRQMLVRLMTGFDEGKYVPRASRCARLSLSALGALLDVEGNWNPDPERLNDPPVGLEQWRHLASLGRDQYVRVVYKGRLACFGHSASLIKVTERKFEDAQGLGGKKTRAAALRQRFFIVVREQVRVYTPSDHKFHGNNFPFTSVEILTKVTPNLRAPNETKAKLGPPGSDTGDAIYGTNASAGQVPTRACFWPLVGPTAVAAKDFLFEIAATDLCGNRLTFSMPLLFVGIEANASGKPKVMAAVRERYNKDTARRTTAFGNAPLGYAEEDAPGDTQLPTGEVHFLAGEVNYGPGDKPLYYPEIEKAQVGIAAIQRLLQKPDETVWVTYTNAFRTNGFNDANNTGKVFLKTLAVRELKFGGDTRSDTLGALATPSMAIQGISQIMGPVAAKPPANPSDPEQIETALTGIMKDGFNAVDFFQGAKILGGVDLGKIIGSTIKKLTDDSVPKLMSSQSADGVEARFDWKTQVTEAEGKLFIPGAGGAETWLTMNGVMRATTTGDTTFESVATLTNFKVNLFDFITLWFDTLHFHAVTGSKTDVTVDLHPDEHAVEFGGPMQFVNTLREIIPSNGFSDPPELTVTPSGIAASFTISVPSLPLGVFTLEHLSLGAGFSLPFDAQPAEVRFNFSERQRPFSLTVSLFGGGGFFLIGLGSDGVREIEAALEFGAAISIDLGVASGSVEVKGGVYFHWLSESVELAGYVRLHGELDVIGLISASLTFHLQLAYRKDHQSSVVWGEATLVVEIEVLCFSGEVEVHCRREFAGSDGDPKFIELIPDQATWDAYCNAFAEEAA